MCCSVNGPRHFRPVSADNHRVCEFDEFNPHQADPMETAKIGVLVLLFAFLLPDSSTHPVAANFYFLGEKLSICNAAQ